MRVLAQISALLAFNVRTLRGRLGSAGAAIFGIAGVVAVLVGVLSIGEGFRKVMVVAGKDDTALVLRAGADSEMTSVLGRADVDVIRDAPGVARGTDGKPIMSPELFVIVDLPKRSTNTAANVPLRGVQQAAFAIRPEVKIVEGRQFGWGKNEVIVGRGAHGQFISTNVGDTIDSGKNKWQVVGVFEAQGGVAETEIWGDARTLQGVYQRGNTFQVVLARLESQDAIQTFSDWLTTNPQLNVMVRRENEYYAAQSRLMTTLIQSIGFGIAALMGIGAVFGAILTMYTAVATRAREIATLRALGFNTAAVLASVVGESMALGAIGGLIGGIIAYIGFNGYQTSTMNFQTFSQVAFAFRVTPGLLATGLVYALAMGFIGGLFPAVRAARLPIPTALREL